MILSGDFILGDLKVYGDNASLDALNEDELAFNLNDGNDIIDIGNNNQNVFVYGQGGNDKIVGGYGSTQTEKMTEKALKWARNIQSGFLSKDDVAFGITTSLHPAITYREIPTIEVFKSIRAHVLSPMG